MSKEIIYRTGKLLVELEMPSNFLPFEKWIGRSLGKSNLVWHLTGDDVTMERRLIVCLLRQLVSI